MFLVKWMVVLMIYVVTLLRGCDRMNECKPKWLPCLRYPFISDTRPNGLCDSHDVSGETFFGPRLNIDMPTP